MNTDHSPYHAQMSSPNEKLSGFKEPPVPTETASEDQIPLDILDHKLNNHLTKLYRQRRHALDNRQPTDGIDADIDQMRHMLMINRCMIASEQLARAIED